MAFHVCQNIQAIPSDLQNEWESYLQWATRQFKRSIAKPTDERTTQGEELLVRLLEPCQARCSFCICRSAQPDLVSSADDIEERMLRIAEGYKNIVFTGGEPTLVKDLPQLLQRAKELGYKKIGLQSNGIKLIDMEYAKILVQSGLNYVLQSFHSHKPSIHKGIFKIEGCFEQCKRSVQNLLHLNIRVALNYVTTKQNISGHKDFVLFVKFNFIRSSVLGSLYWGKHPSITFSSMSPQGWGEQNMQDLPKLSEVAASNAKLLVVGKKNKVKFVSLVYVVSCLFIA